MSNRQFPKVKVPHSSLQDIPLAATAPAGTVGHVVGRHRAFYLVFLGSVSVATLDLTFASLYWRSQGVSVQRVLQSVASGFFGKASRDGGALTAVIGAIAHYFIAACMVVAYYLASKRISMLLRYPISFGLLYGLVLYGFMNLIVLPLSAVGLPSFANIHWVTWSIVVHAIIGVCCSVTARFAHETRAPTLTPMA